MAKNLSELPLRTDTKESDYLHINTGTTNSDYKQTKSRFLANVYERFNYSFDTTTPIIDQVDTLQAGIYHGNMNSYGSQAATGMPSNSNFIVTVFVYTRNYEVIEAKNLTNGETWTRIKNNGAWGNWSHPYMETKNPVQLLNTTAITTTPTTFSCAWHNYVYLLICGRFYGNVQATILVPTSYFGTTTSASRIQMTNPYRNTVLNIYQNGNGSIYMHFNAAPPSSGTDGVYIYGIGAI